MKKLMVGAVLALAVSAFLPRAASADLEWNGTNLQGVRLNGISPNGPVIQGVNLQGIRLNGLTYNGALLQGGERPAPQCTAAGVDFSAVPLAKVTVRLPQRVR